VKALQELRTALESSSGDVAANSAFPLAASARVKAVAVALHGTQKTKQETSLANTTSRATISQDSSWVPSL
jgi:hypothetical protein